jgi:hypothetical protein
MFKKKSIPIVFFLAGLLSISVVQAQESVNTAGGDAAGSGGSAAYSIGQLVYTTNTGGTGEVAQGVQHAYEIYTFGISHTDPNISLAVFPNPTSDNLTLQVSDYNNEKWSYQLFDLQGQLLSNGQIVSEQTQISLNSFASSSYYVHVVNQENKKVQSFKIIKK